MASEAFHAGTTAEKAEKNALQFEVFPDSRCQMTIVRAAILNEAIENGIWSIEIQFM